MRLRRRQRFDAIRNDVRKRGRSWGRWIYLGLVGLFFFWIFRIFVGDLVYFRADGLVLRDRVVIATQYMASVQTLNVEEGAEVAQGDVIAELVSQSVEEGLARLTADLADLLLRGTQLAVRKNIIDETAPRVAKRLANARAAREASERPETRGLYTVERRHVLNDNEIKAATVDAEFNAERRAMDTNLPKLQAAIDAATRSIARLKSIYAGGTVKAPARGVVGHLYVRKGSVAKAGEPLMEIFHGPPYILAYVPEGALYRVEVGDRIKIGVGFATYAGVISRIYPVTAQLPREFSDAFRQPPRAQVVRIEFEAPGQYPTLFARIEVSAADWPPRWLVRLWHSVIGENPASASAPQAGRTGAN